MEAISGQIPLQEVEIESFPQPEEEELSSFKDEESSLEKDKMSSEEEELSPLARPEVAHKLKKVLTIVDKDKTMDPKDKVEAV